MPYNAHNDEFWPAGAFRYRRHQPEKTLLYQLVEQHWPAFQSMLEAQGKRLPGYVVREFEDYLKCGRLEHGFLRHIPVPHPNTSDTGKRMIRFVDSPVAVVQVTINAASTLDVVLIVRARKHEALHDAEVRFDEIEPGGLAGGEHRMNAQLFEQLEKSGIVVKVVEVIQHDIQPGSRIAGAQSAECIEQLDQTFALVKHTTQAVGMHVIESKELLGPFRGGEQCSRGSVFR